MAKKKKSKKKKSGSRLALNLKPGVSQEILGVVLFGLAVLIVIAIFGGGGGLIDAMFTGFRWLIGRTAFLLPLILVFVGIKLFRVDDESDLTFSTYLGLVMLTLSLSGLFHIGFSVQDSLTAAQDGLGGGMSGYIMHSILTALVSKGVAVIVLLVLFLIGLLVALNVRLSDIFAWFKSTFSREDKDESPLKAPVVSGMKLNANVPISSGRVDPGGSEQRSSFRKKSPATSSQSKEEHTTALTAVQDPNWEFPSIELLESEQGEADPGDHEANAEIIKSTFGSFGMEVDMEEVNVGPRVTQYTLRPPEGVRLNKITALDHNLSLALAATSIRIEAPIPGKRAVGIEVPNITSASVRMRGILEQDAWNKTKSPLAFALGQNISGNAAIGDLESMPHLLVAGATGSGKSVMLNSFLTSLLYRNSPANLQMILVDPKRVELNLYNGIPHLLTPVIVDPEKCISALKWAVEEMERRYEVLAEQEKRNIGEFNRSNKQEAMPYIVIVIDELADLMMLAARDVENLIVRLAQKARATGIHLVLATQRPSVNVITGLIKANVPARIAFSTASQVDSRTILDAAGAEKLLGKGDMLFQTPETPKPIRVQGVYIDEKEVKAVTEHLRMQREPEYNDEILKQHVQIAGMPSVGGSDDKDIMYDEAVQTVVEMGKASASLLQRKLRVGYARAARIIEEMEERGVVGPADGARPRSVLINSVTEIAHPDDEIEDEEI